MKAVVIAVVCACCLSGIISYGIGSSFNKSPRVAYVNSQAIIEGFQPYKDAQQILLSKYKDQQYKVDSLNTVYYKRLGQIDTTNISDEEKLELDQLLLVRNQTVKSSEEYLLEEDSRISKGISNQVNAAIQSFAVEHGYDIILSTTSEGNIAYGSEIADITEEILDFIGDEK